MNAYVRRRQTYRARRTVPQRAIEDFGIVISGVKA